MSKVLRYLGQAIVYAAIAVLLAYFADSPSYQRLPDGHALVKLSFAHGADRKGGCRQLSREELAKLPPNMRMARSCPRERLPVVVELELDGDMIFAETLPPTGLHGDGPSQTYQRINVPAGRHRFVARLRDTDREEGFDYVQETEVDLKPGQNFAIDFNAAKGGFQFE